MYLFCSWACIMFVFQAVCKWLVQIWSALPLSAWISCSALSSSVQVLPERRRLLVWRELQVCGASISVQSTFTNLSYFQPPSPTLLNCRYLHISGPDSESSGAGRSLAPIVNTSALPGNVSAARRGSEPSLFPVLRANGWRRRGSEPLVTSLSFQQASQHPTTDIVEEEEHAALEAGSILHQQGKLI